MIKINSLHKFFNKGRSNEIHVINDVSLDLPQKGIVAIFGKSGCGKTTLLNVIGGLDSFHSGSVAIKGEDVSKDPDILRNKYMGYIFQNYNLHKEETCAENVANALLLCGVTDKDIIEKRVNAALTNVGMEKYAKRTPDTLSGGQQQRIAIARAIVKNPPIILADEPTGNLDEANTVMIMDLLKEISKEHLVLLVTHEANLVDYYCDMVIELSDGKVVNVRKNENATGFSGKDKNAIYLGEYEKSEVKNENVEIEYYGENVTSPLKLKVVNKDGKIYLRVDSSDVRILDNSSEVVLREGIYKEKTEVEFKNNKFQMSDLPPVSGNDFGRLFNLKKSFKSGYAAVSKRNKKGKNKNMLRKCMGLFAAVLVFMSAVFGTFIGNLIEYRESYSQNVFYVNPQGEKESEKLVSALNQNSVGIDFMTLSRYGGEPEGDETIFFFTGAFESFDQVSFWGSEFETNMVVLDTSLAEKLTLKVGKKEGLSDYEAIISTKAADKLLEKSTLGYIKNYDDLLGLITENLSVSGNRFKIVGVVESSESAIYLPELSLANLYHINNDLVVCPLNEEFIKIPDGEAIIGVYNSSVEDIPAVGDTIKIHAKEIKIKDIYKRLEYKEYLEENKIVKKSEKDYFSDKMKEKYPDLSPKDEEYTKTLISITENGWGEYLEYYYSEYDGYFRYSYLLFPNDYELWLYVEKGLNVAKSNLSEDYYTAISYKEKYGRYPTRQEAENFFYDLPEEYELYKSEYNKQYNSVYDITYFVNEKDYIELSKRTGETHKSAVFNGYYGGGYYDDYYNDDYYTEVYPETFIGGSYNLKEYYGNEGEKYVVVHTTSPKETAKFLDENFSESSVLTPDEIFDTAIAYAKEEIISNLVTMAVFLALMSVCMYFIMRSSLMNKIKEIGIYRAIGTSKKNLTFRFLIESLVLAMVTVFVGYILASGFIWACLMLSGMLESVFFYPVWYALIVFAVLIGLCVICGIIPIMMLLRKTPSQILAKYDI